MKYEQTLALCKKFNVQMKLEKGSYRCVTDNIPIYLSDSIEKHSERLYEALMGTKDNMSDKKPVLLWSSLLEDYFTFIEGRSNNITRIAFLSGIDYTGEELSKLMSLDKEGKKFYHEIRTEFK